jgi:transposase
MRKRAALLAQGHHTNAQYHVPDIGKHIAYPANREGGAECFHDPAVPKPIEGDLALITSDDALRRDWERAILQTATQHHPQTLSVLQTVPGIGNILSLVRRYAIHDIGRCPRGQDCASSARLGKCSKESAGKRVGTSGKKIGNAPRTWAFAEAAPLCLRHTPTGQKRRTRWEKKHGTGKALTSLPHKLARAL